MQDRDAKHAPRPVTGLAVTGTPAPASGEAEQGDPVGFDRPATLHIVSPDAGLDDHHSVLLGVMCALPLERHIVIYTRPLRDEAAFSRITAAGGFALYGLVGLSPEDHWAWVQGRLAVLLPQRAMIHAAPDDPLAAAAARLLATRLGRRLYVLHGYSPEGTAAEQLLGPELAGATHVVSDTVDKRALRAAMVAATGQTRLHLARLCAPFVPDLNRSVGSAKGTKALIASIRRGLRRLLQKARDILPVDATAKGPLVTASAGMPDDIARFGVSDMADLMLSLVQATGERHLHIGPIDPPLWHAVQERLREQDLPEDRILFTGPVGTVASHLIYHRVGLFLGSLPGVVHCTGLPCAAWAKVPVARYVDKAQSGHGPQDCLDWSSVEELCDLLRVGFSSAKRARLSASSAQWYARKLSPQRFARHLTALLDVTEGPLTAASGEEEAAAAVEAVFDAEYYLKCYPDVARSGMDPLQHYCSQGEGAGRAPNPLFQPWHYRAQLPEGLHAVKGGLLAHYLLRGEARGLTPHPYFVPASAAQDMGALQSGDQASPAGASILARYLRRGRGNVRPHPLFDPVHYARGLALSAGDVPLLLHYLDQGADSGLSPHPLISPALVAGWGATDPRAGLLGWLAGVGAGPTEVTPDALFDPSHLCGTEAARYARAAPNMLWAHLIEGNRPDRGPHLLIDPSHIAGRRPEVLTGTRPILLEMAQGRMARIDTHPLVSTAHVLAQAPWCTDHPTRHYLLRGKAENLDPHPYFSNLFYTGQVHDTAGLSPLVHYLVRGQFDGNLPHPFFDGNFYWQRYLRDEQGGAPLPDYVQRGAGRFRTVLPHDTGARRSALRAAQVAFAVEETTAAAEILLKEALHPVDGHPHPTLQVETRPLLAAWPEGMLREIVLPPAQVALSRAAVVSRNHVAPPPLRHDLPEVSAALWSGAFVIGGADGFGTKDGQWWAEGAEHGPLPGSALAQDGAFALREGTPLAARRQDAVLLRWHRPALSFAQAIMACGSGSTDLDRFVLEVLPRALLAAQIAPPGTPVLTDGDLSAQASQALRLALPDHPILKLARGQAARIDHLYAAGLPNRLEEALADPAPDAKPPVAALRLHPGALELLRARLTQAARPPTARRLFLCAQQSSRRRLLNAEAMGAGLARCGFQRQDPALLGFAELAALVQGADEIVATECPQLALLVLARPGTKVWVLHGNAAGVDFHRWDTLGRMSGLQMAAVAGWQVPGSAGIGTRPNDAHYEVPLDLVVPFFDTRLPQDSDPVRLLDHLQAATDQADTLTAAWAVLARPTPDGFEARLRYLRLRAADGITKAEAAALKDLLAHPFFVDVGRSLRSGYPVLGGFSDWEQEVADQVLSVLSGEAAPGPLAGDALEGEAGARLLALLAMLLLPCWKVPLPEAPAALPEDVVERRLAFAMSQPALIHPGEDALWVAHVERLLHWLADQLAPESTVPPSLRVKVQRMAGRLDLGQLLLIDHPLRGVQAARNRVLERVALGHAGEVPPRAIAGRIRIGILCRTFEKGPDSEAVLAFCRGFDPAKYQLFAYSIGFRDRVVSRDPAFDRLFDATVPQRRDLPADPAGVRARLLADGLDVFLYANATTYGLQPLDLALFHRVAPVQLVLNSHVPMPMGYPSFDGVITGTSDDPAQEVPQSDFAETLIRLPGPVINYLTTLEPKPNPPLDRAALGLRPTDVVMMNAGSSMKLRHENLTAMMQAVAGVPDGVLLLAPYNPGWAARSMAFVFNRQLAETAEAVGLDPARIRVLGELSVAEAEAALSCADLYLNPFPHGGATMTHLALIHGVPPVTLRRRSTRSIDQFLVESHGFGELLADTPEGYVALAQTLARDPARRADLVARLREAAKTPGFVNNAEYAQEMQRAVGAAWAARSTGL